MFVVSWRYMIPSAVYHRASLGTFVFHDSLLPKYRGFAPTVWAIINGEDHTGVTLFEIAEGVDEGLIVAQHRVEIGQQDSIATVMENVTEAYLHLLELHLPSLLEQSAPRIVQDHLQATYTVKRMPQDNRIDWRAPTRQTYDLIRAVTKPYPGAFTYLADRLVRVWSADYVPDEKQYAGIIPGRVAEVRAGIGTVVLTGDGSLLLRKVQVDDGEVACAADVLNHLSDTLG